MVCLTYVDVMVLGTAILFFPPSRSECFHIPLPSVPSFRLCLCVCLCGVCLPLHLAPQSFAKSGYFVHFKKFSIIM